MCFVIVIFVLVVAAAVVVADVVVLVSNLVVMVLSLVLVLVLLVLVLVRQGQELTAYHPTCLRVRDKTNRILERSIRR